MCLHAANIVDDESTIVISKQKRRFCVLGGVAVLVCHIGALAWLAYVETPVWHEPAHMAAGLCCWSFGRFDSLQVNPPLVRQVATLSVLPFRPLVSQGFDQPASGRDEYDRGGKFIWDNEGNIRLYFTVARWTCISFSLVGALVCWTWGKTLFGEYAGLLAMILWCFCPYILGHGATILTDVPAAAVGATAVYCFWRWLRVSRWLETFQAGLALGIAALTKFTLIVLYPLLPILWIVYGLSKRQNGGWKGWVKQGMMLCVITLLSVYIVNCGYLFRGTLTQLGKFPFRTQMLSGCSSPNGIVSSQGHSNRFAGTWLGEIPVPLPFDFVLGIDLQRLDFERGLPSYLHGEWSDHGWWYYYLYALIVKIPLGTWCLVLAAIGISIFDKTYSTCWRDEIVTLVPILAIMVLLGLESGFSTHSRYAIPALPFLFVWTSKVARAFEMRQSVVATIVASALIWSTWSSLWYYPHSLSYFNELVGGPTSGPKHLLDSNIDWGQDLFRLRTWLDRHPEAHALKLAYFGQYPQYLAGLNADRPPPGPFFQYPSRTRPQIELGPHPGWYALSVMELYSRCGEYRHFLYFEPVTMAGYSIYVYHISLDEANRVRRELGLSELPENGGERLGAGDGMKNVNWGSSGQWPVVGGQWSVAGLTTDN